MKPRPLSLALAFALIGGGLAAQPPAGGTLAQYRVHSRALEANLLGDPADQSVEVYTPPSYQRDAGRRYPVLFLLHGIGGTSADWTKPGYQDMTIQGLMDSLAAARAIREMIVVLPTARNAYAGSYYANSPVTGNWEDYIAGELVAWVDSAFRTIPRAASRGIAGHSMGGFGALRLGMRHPGVFGAVYAMSPCCLGMAADIGPDNPVWGRIDSFRDRKSLVDALQTGDFYPIAVVSLAAVVSPNPRSPPFFVDLPFRKVGGEVRPVDSVLARWRAAFPVAQVGQWKDSLAKLRVATRIDYGFDDEFPHIPPTVRMFADSLAAYRVPHRLEAYNGDHRNRIRARMTVIVLPFFSAALSDRP